MSQAITKPKHFVPDADLASELVATYGSPLYVYDSQHLLEEIHRVSGSVKYPRTQFAFASVTNGNLALLRYFKTAGWGLHANTPGDAFLGMRAGFAPSDIIYSGSNLTALEMEEMLRLGISTFNLDSLSQLRLLCRTWTRSADDCTADGPSAPIVFPNPPRLGFRLNLPEVTGESRIGINAGELKEAQSIASAHGLEVTGVHFYRGTSTNATERFSDCIERVIDACHHLSNWQYLDFGGGFGFPYYDRRQTFEWQEFGDALTSAIKRTNREIDLVIEPGRSIIAGSAALLCTVVSSKWQGEKQIVGVDTNTANIAVLSVHGGTRQVRCYRHNEPEHQTDVCGNTTYSRDYLSRATMLPEMAEGDLLAILDAGAYGYSMSSHFLHRPRLPEVLIENGSHRLIRKRETYDCLLANQVE